MTLSDEQRQNVPQLSEIEKAMPLSDCQRVKSETRISGKMGVRFDEGAECVIDEGAEQLRQREREMEQLRERDGMFVCVCDCGR